MTEQGKISRQKKRAGRSGKSSWWKMTRADGTDFYTGTVNYAAALASGETIEVLDPSPVTGNVCGRGLHVCDTPRKTIRFGERRHRPYRWFEVDIDLADIIEQDAEKARTRKILRVVREIGLADIFGKNCASHLEEAKVEISTWKKIPWLKPPRLVNKDELTELFHYWLKAINPWLRNKKRKLPKKLRIVYNINVVAAAAAAAAAAASDAFAAAAAADAADAFAADAFAAAAANDAAAAAASDAFSADAFANDAAAAADAANDAAAAADDAAAAANLQNLFSCWQWWYLQPRCSLWSHARWKIANLDQPSPWEPIIAIWRLGCVPIGFIKDQFVIYLPKRENEK